MTLEDGWHVCEVRWNDGAYIFATTVPVDDMNAACRDFIYYINTIDVRVDDMDALLSFLQDRFGTDNIEEVDIKYTSVVC